MAFTNPELIAMRRIFGPLITKRLTDSTQADVDAFLGLLDPAVGTNTYVKARIQDAKDRLTDEAAAAVAAANARVSQINNVEIPVLNGLLAKFP